MFPKIGRIRCGCVFNNLQMPRPPVVYLLPGNGSRGCLSIAIRRSALAGIYHSGRCETIRPRDQESQPDTSNASVNVFLLVTRWGGALKCGAGNSDVETIACEECPFTSPCDLSNTARETAEWRPL
jgi:hypothetical protein